MTAHHRSGTSRAPGWPAWRSPKARAGYSGGASGRTGWPTPVGAAAGAPSERRTWNLKTLVEGRRLDDLYLGRPRVDRHRRRSIASGGLRRHLHRYLQEVRGAGLQAHSLSVVTAEPRRAVWLDRTRRGCRSPEVDARGMLDSLSTSPSILHGASAPPDSDRRRVGAVLGGRSRDSRTGSPFSRTVIGPGALIRVGIPLRQSVPGALKQDERGSTCTGQEPCP